MKVDKSQMRSRKSVWAFVFVGVLAGVTVGGGVRVAAAPSTTVRWKVSSLAAGQVKNLSALVSSNSPGVKSWSKMGSCKLTPSGKPTKLKMGLTGSCVLTLKISQTKSFPAKSSRKTITVAAKTITVPTTTTTTVATLSYSVSYNGNTFSSGAVPSDVNSYSSSATVTVVGNSGSLAKTGYTFGGWCTTQPAVGAACSGTTRAAASTFAITATTTLYATWTLAAPAFTLSSGSESKVQNVAIAGYTITSTGGTIASYAISPTAPTGLTFNTLTGLLTGTPTTVQSATAYTITATNATGTATQTFTLTVTFAAPAFTLSSGSESKVQNVAIAGYTITSTGGTIASYAISPAAPTGLTFNTLTGLLTGTPTTVQSAAAYTITASNPTGTATRTFTLTVTLALTCATGGVCVVGNTGPGGGKVFYVQAAGGTFACGATLAATCKYLEAAPTSGTSLWADVVYFWSGNTTVSLGATAQGTAIGTGYKNTEAIVTQSNTPDRAGTITRAYRGPNNLTDWYLPSQDELNELYIQRTMVGGFAVNRYWSSSEYPALNAWYQDFFNGNQNIEGRLGSNYVRPVRAF